MLKKLYIVEIQTEKDNLSLITYLEILNNKKPVKRLWLPEQTEETIRTQIKLSEDNKKYTDLHNEGIARTYIDWLLGINLSVFLKNKTGVRLNVGRVMIPVVKFIYDRDMEIKNCVSKNLLPS